MADDDTAKTALVFDASGAQKGAADFKQAAETVIAADAAVGQAADKAAETVSKAATKTTTARRSAAQAATEASRKMIADAAAAGDALVAATDRAATSYSRQTRFLDGLAKQFNPLGAAADAAAGKLQALLDITAKGGPNAQRAAAMVDQAAQRLVAAQEALSGIGDRAAEVARLVNVFDPARASAQRMTAELADLNKALKLGVVDAGQHARAWDGIVEKYDEGAMAAKRAAAAQRTLIEEARAAQTAANAQSGFNQRLGVRDPGQAKSARDSASVFEEEFAANEKLLAERKALEAELNPLKTASLAYAAALERVQRAVDLGVISEKQAVIQRQRVTDEFAKANAPLSDLNQKLGQHTTANGQAAFAQRQFSVQMVQLFSSIQGGQPIILAMIQQLHQVLDVALATGTGFGVLGQAIKKGFGYLISPIGLMVAAGAGLVALGVAAESTARRLVGLRNQLSAVRDDAAGATQMADDAARKLAGHSDMSTANARTMVNAIYTAPQFQGTEDQAVKVGKIFNDLAKQLNEDTAQVAERAKQAFEDPGAAAVELSKRLTSLRPEMVKHIQDLQAQGHQAEATTTLLRALADATKPVQSNVTELSKAWTELENALYGTEQRGKSLIDVMGGNIDHLGAKVLGWIKDITEAMKSAVKWLDDHSPDWLEKMLNSGKPAGGAQPSGQKVTENDGAVGLFQLRQAAAKDVGLTVAPSGAAPNAANDQRFDYNMNLIGGERYFRQQFEATGGNLDTATRAYNQGLGGAQQGLGADYLASVKKQDPNRLPADVKKDIEDAFYKLYSDIARTAAGPEVLHRLEQIAMQESKGHHYADPTVQPGGPGAATAPGAVTAPGTYGPSLPEDFGARDRLNDQLKRGQELYDRLGPLSKELNDNRRDIIAASAALQAAVTRANIARGATDLDTLKLAQQEVAHAQETLRKLQGARTDILSPARRAAREAFEATIPLSAEPGAAREFADLQEKQRQRARSAGEDDAGANAQERVALQTRLTAAMNENIRNSDLQVAAEQRLMAAYEGSARSLQHLENQEKARIEALQFAKRGTDEYKAAVEALTSAYDRKDAVATDKAAASSISRMKQETEQLQLQLQLVTATNAERDRAMAMLQERQQRGLGPTDKPTAEDQKAIKLAGQNSGLRTQVQQTQAAYRELEQTGDRIFETFEKALTEPLREGETAAQRFGSVMVSVLTDVEKELLKLAVINPLKNALFGGEHRPEIGDVGGLLGGGKGGLIGKLFGLGGGDTGRTGKISSDAGGAGIANRQSDPALADQLINANGDAGMISGNPGGPWGAIPPAGPGANDGGTAVLASSTDKLVTSLGDQVSTIKDQVGSINSLVDTGQNQVGAIGNLVTSLGAGGCGCGGGPGGGQGGGQGGGGILGSLFSKVGGMFGGSGMGAGGDGMASGGDLSALSTEASSNVSAGAAGLHGGGLVGYDPPSFTRLVDPAMFANAPRFHAGLGADEFAAILQKGERVLTGQQQKQVHAAANSNNSGGGHNFTFNFPADASPDGFRRAGAQVATQVQSSLARAKARNTI